MDVLYTGLEERCSVERGKCISDFCPRRISYAPQFHECYDIPSLRPRRFASRAVNIPRGIVRADHGVHALIDFDDWERQGALGWGYESMKR